MGSSGRSAVNWPKQEEPLRQGLTEIPTAADQRSWSPAAQHQESSQQLALRDALDAKLAVVLVLDPTYGE